MGARDLLPRVSADHKRGNLVFVLSRAGATPVVADVGTCACGDHTLRISTVVVCSGDDAEPVVVRGKSEEDRQRLRGRKVEQTGTIGIRLLCCIVTAVWFTSHLEDS